MIHINKDEPPFYSKSQIIVEISIIVWYSLHQGIMKYTFISDFPNNH